MGYWGLPLSRLHVHVWVMLSVFCSCPMRALPLSKGIWCEEYKFLYWHGGTRDHEGVMHFVLALKRLYILLI